MDVLATGKIVKLLKQLRDIYPSTTRGTYMYAYLYCVILRICLQLFCRNHLQLRQHLKTFEVPVEVVGDFKAILQEMVADLDVWMSKRCIREAQV